VTLTIETKSRSRSTDPSTSHDAAERAGALAQRQFAIISAALRHCGGTIYDLAEATGLDHFQVARRLPEMERLGLAEPTGETAPSPSGRQCRVWRGRKLQKAVGE
jgi:hypothetical protein